MASVGRMWTGDEEVSKTISQARYGANAEMGRKWRGPEKKDAKAPAVAVAGAGVGLAGGATAIAGRRKLKSVGPEVVAAPARETTGLKVAHGGAMKVAHTAAEARGKSEHRLSEVKRLHGEWVDRDKTGVSRKHPFEGHAAPGHPTGKVGPRGGGFKHLETFVEGAHKQTHEAWSAADQKAADAARALRGAETHNATRHAVADAANVGRKAAIKGSKRLIRGGGAVAGLGGLAAIGAGIKAERDRKTGLGKPKRTRVALQMSDAQRRANGL